MTAKTVPIATDTEALPADLQENLRTYADQAAAAYSENTARAIRADTARFASWCGERNLTNLPATAETVAAFVDAMAPERAAATVQRYVASIGHLHRAAGAADPTRTEVVRLALRRLRRTYGTRQRQAAGITSDLRARLLDAADPARIKGLRDRALLAVAYDTLMRRSELAALELSDLSCAADGSGSVLVRRSKGDPDGRGQVRYLAPDTLTMVRAWLSAAGVADGPLFRTLRKGGAVRQNRLDPGDIARIFKELGRAAGARQEAVQQLSGHSTRIGAAQDLVAIGVGIPQVMRDGGWRSPTMIARYTEHQDIKHGGMARLAATQRRG